MGKPQIRLGTKKLHAPRVISASQAARFLWGDTESGFVSDWIYGSSEHIHMMAFSLAVGRRFGNSSDFRTCYNAHETYYCLKGEFTFSNPETGDGLRPSQRRLSLYASVDLALWL
jgi:hypothetical protein